MDRFLISRGHRIPYERMGELNFWGGLQERIIGETIGPDWKFDALIVDEGQDFEQHGAKSSGYFSTLMQTFYGLRTLTNPFA